MKIPSKKGAVIAPNSQPTVQLQKADDTEKEIFQEDTTPVSMVQEPLEMDVPDNYSSLSITDLKKVAKQGGFLKLRSIGLKRENKTELIALIKKTPEPPNLL